MRNSLRTLLCIAPLALVVLAGCGRHAQRPASSLTEKDRAVLADYEKIRAALAEDDLRTTLRTAQTLVDDVKPSSPSDKPSDYFTAAKLVAGSTALDTARTSFRELSAVAIRQAGDVAGFYVMTSPMTGSDWLQTSAAVDNPYLGAAMRGVGEPKK